MKLMKIIATCFLNMLPVFATATPILQGVSISGPNSVNENSSTQYTATAVFKDSVTAAVTSSNVTSTATWSESSVYLTSVTGGLVKSAAVTANQLNIAVTAKYVSGSVSKTATKSISILNVVPVVTLQSLAVICPASVSENSSATCSATATYSDATTKAVAVTSIWNLAPVVGTITAGVYTSGTVSTDTSITISASFTEGGITVSNSANIIIINAAAAQLVTGSHAGRFTTYEGSKTCAGCHAQQVTEVFNSAHYQWAGDSRYVSGSNASGLPMGKLNGINDFCIYPKFNVGCYKCHVGSGLVPSTTQSQAQLDNIDCLTCHVSGYKRTLTTNLNGTKTWKPDFVATTTPFTIVLPDRAICLSCHATSGGGNNWKRGDLELAHGTNADRNFDVHMNSSGANIQCTDCHSTQNHHIAGKGSDLRQIDSAVRVDCTNCHLNTPHTVSANSARLNIHTKRVHCTTCHIPTYAKSAPTDMFRDWSQPGEWDAAKNQYDPWRVMASNVTPVYKFWNWGYATTMNLGDPAIPGANGNIDMSTPVGSIADSGAKIYPFKYHIGNQPFDPSDSTLLPLFISDFFGQNNINLAVQNGASKIGKTLPQGFTYAKTERYLGLFHGVAPKAQALACAECHNTPTPTRINLKAMGYQPNAQYNGKALCASCHSAKTANFTTVHQKHVTERGYDCSRCHTFAKAL